jgi:type I restriction enzyme R subunit
MFNESNTVEVFIRDLLCGPQPVTQRVVEHLTPYRAGRAGRGAGWHYVPAAQLPRRPNDVFVEDYVREALIRLNPSIAADHSRADEVLYKLRAIVLSVRSDGLIRANETFTAWLRGERSMPFGPDYAHVTVRLVDYDDLDQNQYVVTTQYAFRAGKAERRADLLLLVNGFPLVLVEAKTPVRDAVSWADGALQVHDDYEQVVPELFVCNVFSMATEGKALHYGAIGAPVEQWGPWRVARDLPPFNPPPTGGEKEDTSPPRAGIEERHSPPPPRGGLRGV